MLDLIITLMTLLVGFATTDYDVCYEGINTTTAEIMYYRDRDKINFTIGINVDPIQFICRPRDGTQRYFASVSTCGEVSNTDRFSVNINETGCDTNCHSYVITPIEVECILLKCERDPLTNSNSTEECSVYINIINETSPSQSTFTASVNTRSLESANETEISTIVAICVVIAVVIFVGLIIYLCCKGLQHKRRSHDIEDQRRPPDMNSPPVAIVSYNVNQSDEIQSTNSTEVVVGNELLKVTNPENEESDTTDLILSTRVQRMAPHSRVQRGYESEIKVYEEETMRESVKSASITLGEMSEDTVTVVHHYQETDKYSNAYCFSTMTGKQHHPNGNAGPIVKTVVQENEVTWICTK